VPVLSGFDPLPVLPAALRYDPVFVADCKQLNQGTDSLPVLRCGIVTDALPVSPVTVARKPGGSLLTDQG